MSFRLAFVGAASLLCLFALAPSAAEPTRRENAIAAAAAQGRLEDLRPLLEGEKPSPAIVNDALVGAAQCISESIRSITELA